MNKMMLLLNEYNCLRARAFIELIEYFQFMNFIKSENLICKKNSFIHILWFFTFINLMISQLMEFWAGLCSISLIRTMVKDIKWVTVRRSANNRWSAITAWAKKFHWINCFILWAIVSIRCHHYSIIFHSIL